MAGKLAGAKMCRQCVVVCGSLLPQDGDIGDRHLGLNVGGHRDTRREGTLGRQDDHMVGAHDRSRLGQSRATSLFSGCALVCKY